MANIGELPYQPPPQALRLSHGRGAKQVTGDEPQGTSLARCILPAFLCAHIFIKREASGYEVASLWSLGDRTQDRISEEIEFVPLRWCSYKL